jgi:hypothetical protein
MDTQVPPALGGGGGRLDVRDVVQSPQQMH